MVLAGPSVEMRAFLDGYPEIRGNIARIVEFPDFTLEELRVLTQSMLQATGYRFADGAEAKFADALVKVKDKEGTSFSNARSVRTLLEQTYKTQARRLITTRKAGAIDNAALNIILPEDVP